MVAFDVGFSEKAIEHKIFGIKETKLYSRIMETIWERSNIEKLLVSCYYWLYSDVSATLLVNSCWQVLVTTMYLNVYA